MQRNSIGRITIKEEIDQKAKNYLNDLKNDNKQELENLKMNSNQNITNTRSFIGYSKGFFDLNSLEVLTK